MMSIFGSNKKGMARDIMAVIIFLLVFGFSVFLGYTLWSNMVSAWETVPIYNSSTVMQSTAAEFTGALLMYDNIIILILVVLMIGLGLANYRLRTAPAFMIIAIIEAAMIGFVSFFFNFIWIQLVSDAIFATTRSLFPKTYLLLTNFHWIALILFVIGVITLYGKRQNDNEVYG